jgi:uncharacterized membrane protein SirB2
MPYLAIKHLHVTLAALSVLLYTLRGIWMLRGSALAQITWVRILPHIVYTALILAGAILATLSGQWGATWIWLKLALLGAVIALGVLAFSRRSTLPASRRMSVWGMGLVLFIMIFAVAAHHHALVTAGQPPGADDAGASTPDTRPPAHPE